MPTETINTLQQFKQQEKTRNVEAKNDSQNKDKSIFEDSNKNTTTNTIKNLEPDDKEENIEKEEKLSFSESAKALLKGGINKVKEQADSLAKFAKDDPVAALSVVAWGLSLASLTFACPPVGYIVGMAGAGVGLYNLIKDIPDVKDALEDLDDAKDKAEKEKALYNLGYEGMDVVEDTALFAVGTAETAASIKFTGDCCKIANMAAADGASNVTFGSIARSKGMSAAHEALTGILTPEGILCFGEYYAKSHKADK